MADYRRHRLGRAGDEQFNSAPHWGPRERGGYWRLYELARPHYAAERISGARDVTKQLRITRTNGHDWAAGSSRASGPGITSPQPVSEAAGKGTPSKTTSGTSA